MCIGVGSRRRSAPQVAHFIDWLLLIMIVAQAGLCAILGTGLGLGLCAVVGQLASAEAGYPFRMMWFTPVLGSAMVILVSIVLKEVNAPTFGLGSHQTVNRIYAEEYLNEKFVDRQRTWIFSTVGTIAVIGVSAHVLVAPCSPRNENSDLHFRKPYWLSVFQ